jgi:hypothetical protein
VVSLEVSYMLLSCHQNEGQNHDMKLDPLKMWYIENICENSSKSKLDSRGY